jgi:pimeloyl-ACP methyl ester carboxylesterase
MGHSWGSYLSVKTIEKYPENYLAYVGIGQVVNTPESERLSYDYMLRHAKDIDDKYAIEMLEKYDPHAEGFPLMPEKDHLLDYMLDRTKILNRYDIGHMHEYPQGMTYTSGVVKALLSFKGYTLKEKISWFLGADFSMIHLYPLMIHDDFLTESVKFEIPFYIVHGSYDYQVSQVLSEKYLEALDVPKKEYFLFENSAHSPNMEEPERFVEVFRKIAEENPLEKAAAR